MQKTISPTAWIMGHFPVRKWMGLSVFCSLFSCMLFLELFTQPASAQTGVVTSIPPNSPIAPMESLQWLQVDAGYRVRLVASEPQVIDPIAMQIDDAGRIWVVEMRDYPNGPPKTDKTLGGVEPPGMGRIVILEDENFDGFYEKSTLFADQLRFATGIQLWKEGAFVTAAGELLYLKDTDGDWKSDSREVVLQGFMVGNPQLRANHPTIGPDGALYVANGLRGGVIPSKTEQGRGVDLNGKDLRFDLQNGEIEAITGPSQYGLAFDSYGHRYGCSNRQPCIEAIVEQSDLALSPLAGLAPAFQPAAPGENASSVHPLVNAWTTSNLHAGQFTAACGLLVSDSMQLPNSRYGHLLTCEPTGSLVQRRSLKRTAGRTEVDDEPPTREWMASRDPWFRPVQVYEGPQGGIYVVDMYRAVIEHPEWVPEELKNRPDERLGDDRGRIYLIERDTNVTPAATSTHPSPLRSLKTAELVELISSDHAWTRRTATRLLLERNDPETGGLLRTAAQTAKNAAGRIQAAALLGTMDAWDESIAVALVRDGDSRVRAATWKYLRDQKSLSIAALVELANKAIGSQDLDEIKEASWFLASQGSLAAHADATISAEERVKIAVQAAMRYPNDPYCLMAVAAICKEAQGDFLTEWAHQLSSRLPSERATTEDSDVTHSEEVFTFRAIQRLAQTLNKEDRTRVIRFLDSLVRKTSWESGFDPQRLKEVTRNTLLALELIEGLHTAQEKHGVPIQATHYSWMLQILDSESSTSELKSRALQLLRYAPSSLAIPSLTKHLQGKDLPLKRAALLGVVSHQSADIDNWLFDQLKNPDPALRNEMFAAIRRNPARLLRLVEELETKVIPLQLFDATQRTTLQSSGDSNLKARVQSLLANASNPNREKVVAKYRSTLQGTGRLTEGKAVFTKSCSACHRIGDVGVSVGPDISDARVQSYEKLLIAILDPNRSIDAAYFRNVILTEDGEILEGLLKESTATTITLRGQNGKETTLPRDQIHEVKTMTVSLMPEGLEEQINEQQMVDLLHYIKNWRYAEANVPAEAKP